MKKALKYIAIVLISLLVLLLTLPLSIYIPAVQRWGKNEISGYVGRSTGMELSIGKLSLKFPFRLQIDDILLLTSSRDTLLQSSSRGSPGGTFAWTSSNPENSIERNTFSFFEFRLYFITIG